MMVTIDEALLRIQNQVLKTHTTEREAHTSRGYYLAEPIRAPFDLPDFHNSAMDGYAVCGLQPTYTLAGEVAAGDTADHALKDGQAMRIFTGGKVPANATAVVMQEKTEVKGTTLHVPEPAVAGQNIRLRGSELKQGQRVFDVGHLITPASIGLISSLGREHLTVYRKPAIRLIATGNELINPGAPRSPGQIYESNSLALAAALDQFGYECAGKLQLPDDFAQISAGIRESLGNTDVLLLSGGISVGDYDFVKAALEENDVQEVFYKVMQKPGKPLYFGRKGDQFVFALPGNPASSLTCFYVYVLPLLQRQSGASHGAGLTRLHLPLAHAFELKGDRPAFLKAEIKGGRVTILEGQGSSMIHSMATGNALAYLPKPQKLAAGDPVECLLIS